MSKSLARRLFICSHLLFALSFSPKLRALAQEAPNPLFCEALARIELTADTSPLRQRLAGLAIRNNESLETVEDLYKKIEKRLKEENFKAPNQNLILGLSQITLGFTTPKDQAYELVVENFLRLREEANHTRPSYRIFAWTLSYIPVNERSILLLTELLSQAVHLTSTQVIENYFYWYDLKKGKISSEAAAVLTNLFFRSRRSLSDIYRAFKALHTAGKKVIKRYDISDLGCALMVGITMAEQLDPAKLAQEFYDTHKTLSQQNIHLVDEDIARLVEIAHVIRRSGPEAAQLVARILKIKQAVQIDPWTAIMTVFLAGRESMDTEITDIKINEALKVALHDPRKIVSRLYETRGSSDEVMAFLPNLPRPGQAFPHQ